MSLIELGALASALVAVITLITKLYNLFWTNTHEEHWPGLLIKNPRVNYSLCKF